MSTVPALIPLPAPQPASTGSSSGSQSGSSGLFSGTSIDFKTKFAAAIASLSANGSPNTTVTSTTGTATNATGKVDALQTLLQKKIATMLQQGTSLSDIVQQLASQLASQFAGQFAGDQTQIRAQLQTAFAAALSPPGTTGPPSIADTASALAQRFRQVAEAAAGVSGETGQSNRLFAGSNSDAATTAGAAPAPQPDTSTTGLPTADSILSGALNATANLTLPTGSGDGKTVAYDGPALGSNGDTPIGRILARALNALQSNASAPAAVAPATTPLTASAPTSPLTVPSVASALIAATTSDAAPAATVTPTTTSPASLSPALSAFLSSFSNALAVADGAPASSTVAKIGDDTTDGSGSLLATTVTSTNAPTVAAFLPVQAPFSIDGSNANAPQSANPTASAPAVDPNKIVDQVLQGAFLRTDGITSQVRLSLVPASLGDVNVQLTVTGGTVDAHLVAQTPAAHDALIAGQSQLTSALADAGLKLNSFNVSLAGGFAGFQQQQQQSFHQSQSSGRRLMVGGVDTAEDDDDALLAMPTFGPPLLANQDFGALNYLV